MQTISAQEARERLKQGGDAAALIDVRTPEEYAAGHADGAKNIPLDELPMHFNELKPYKTLIFICQSGGRSHMASQFISQVPGFGEVYNVEGGMSAW